jgi:hypothetical protein
MPLKDKSFYNKMSSEKLGWDPSWFGTTGFGPKLESAVRQFQKEHGLEQDGLVGPMTFSRLYTEFTADDYEENYIILDGEKVAISWDKVDVSRFKLPRENYGSKRKKEAAKIVTHWDATLSAKRCYDILSKRGISSHFVIDNDGTIYQMVDPAYVAWHAGKYNKDSIGIDLSNAYYTKYNKNYEKMGFGPRPILNSWLHGRNLGEHLGYYPAQLKAYKELLKVLCTHYDIPLNVPMTKDGNLLNSMLKESEKNSFKGIICHYHLTENKIDCAGLELDKIVELLKE